MNNTGDALILTINSGSSSIKTALYRIGAVEERLVFGQLQGIGQGEGRFELKDAGGGSLVDERRELPDHATALHALFDRVRRQDTAAEIDAIGHRIVHGGPRFRSPERISTEMLDEVRRLVPFDPLHLPSEVAAIEAVARLFPNVPQVACFDTAFHRTIPDAARLFAIPRRFAEQGVYRYGFHGLSYEYVLEELARVAGAEAARGRVIVAHLGSGASMTAVRDGQSIDTTMGFTPLAGLVMATRCGDIDPGVLLYLLQGRNMSVADLNNLLNHESGLLGVSGTSADMRTLLEQAATDPDAEAALSVYCYQARKHVGALAAALGGLDTLVFTAGVGENASPIRQRICAGLDYLGVALDRARNEASADVISPDGGRVTVRVIPTNEELMIARHTHRALAHMAPA